MVTKGVPHRLLCCPRSDLGDCYAEEREHHFLFEDILGQAQSFCVFDVSVAVFVGIDEVCDVGDWALDEFAHGLVFCLEVYGLVLVDGGQEFEGYLELEVSDLSLAFHVLEEEVSHAFLLGVEFDSKDVDFPCVVFVPGGEHGGLMVRR